VIIPIKIQ